MPSPKKKSLNNKELEAIILLVQERFLKNKKRKQAINWAEAEKKLRAKPEKCWSLHQMEMSGGEPELLDYDEQSKEYLFFDAAPESPKERRSLCYDQQGWDERKDFKPAGNALSMAEEMGIELLDESQYLHLQTYGPFDLKTSSWIRPTEKMRKLGGALFGDHRFGRSFIYHNTAQSYYAGRGFRGLLRV